MGKELTFEETIARMREVLRPQGTLPVVSLRLKSASYVSEEFINSVIDELEKLPYKLAMGEEPSPMQTLAIMVLKDSSWIE